MEINYFEESLVWVIMHLLKSDDCVRAKNKEFTSFQAAKMSLEMRSILYTDIYSFTQALCFTNYMSIDI